MSKILKISDGKTEFHRFDYETGIIEPCINKYNIDFNQGCISNTNPYFKNSEEILSGKILELGMEKVLSRLDDLQDKYLDKLSEIGLYPEVRRTSEFPESLKKKIWDIIEQSVIGYQNWIGKGRIGKYFGNGLGLLDGWVYGCTYCYSGYKNNVQKILANYCDFSQVKKELERIKQNELMRTDKKGKKRLFVRNGKNVECASLFHLDTLSQELDLFIEQGVSIVMPTKHLPFEKSIADKFKHTDSLVGYSLGYEKEEKGAVLYGFDNEYRMHCAKKYADYGVDTMIKIAVDCTQSFDECQKHGGHIYEIIDFIEKNPHIKKQLIPIRMYRIEVIKSITGLAKKQLTKTLEDKVEENRQENLFAEKKQEETGAKYSLTKGQRLVPEFMHKDFAQYFKEHVCGEVGPKFYCDSCQFKDMPVWNLPIEKQLEIDSINRKKRMDRKERKFRNQMKLEI